ncbi:MAG: S8 family serine peptidase [Bacteroidetes bacterium]|nr:S8 family serine peptidase [Bacteroidota bacterium]
MKKAFWQCCCLLALMCLQQTKLDAQRMDYVPGQFLIWLEDKGTLDSFVEDHSSLDNLPTGFVPKKILIPNHAIFLFQFDPAINETAFLNDLKEDKRVKIIQYNHWLENRSLIPDDSLFNQQWNFLNTNGGADIDADLAWEITTGGTTPSGNDIVIALIDDGIDPDHPDLQPNLWQNNAEIPYNGIDDDGNGYIDDYAGWNVQANFDLVQYGIHGVQVSGLLGAKGDNGEGIAGINWDVKIMPIVGISGIESEIIEAYGYALNQRQLWNDTNGAQGAFVSVTNTSWGADFGSPDDYPLWCEMFDLLGEAGIISVAATTNSNVDVDVEGDMPTSCSSPYLITVTATDENDQRNFAGYGLESIDLAAPGEDILTTDIFGQYSILTGTSFACPQVAGLAALLYSAPCEQLDVLSLSAPADAANLVRDAILAGVDPVPQLEEEVNTGGRLNAFHAVETLLDGCTACLSPVGLEVQTDNDSTALVQWVSIPGTIETVLQWREAGNADWNIVPNAETPYFLEGLAACAEYEVRLKALCDGQESQSITQGIFTTLGCCEAPDGLQLIEINEEDGILCWDAVYGASSYTYQYKLESDPTWSDPVTTGGTTVMLSGLMPCESYQFLLQAACGIDQQSPYSIIAFEVPGCEDCSEQNYCFPEFSPWFEWIESFSINGQEILTGNNDGYYQHTDVAFNLTPGGTYSFSIVPGFSDWTYPEYYMIWIDYDQDEIFDQPTELVWSNEDPTDQVITDTITLDTTALPGITRLRLIQVFGNSGTFSCTVFEEYGETEDYCIYIDDSQSPGLPCMTNVEFEASNILEESALISWNSDSLASQYAFRWRKEVDQDWNESIIEDSQLQLTGLDECTIYEVQVQTLCGANAGAFSESYLFQTACIQNAISLSAKAGKILVYPNPFEDELFFKGASETDYQLALFSVDGRLLQQWEISTGLEPESRLLGLNLKLAAGMYYLRWQSEGAAGVFPLVHH